MPDEPTTTPPDEGQVTPQPSTVTYLGREMTADELLSEAQKKDAYITQLHQERKSEPEITPAAPDEDEALKQARQALEQMGIVDKSAIEKMLDEKLSAREQQQQLATSFKETAKKYTGKGDYADYPAFNEAEVLQHAQSKGILDPEAAYRDLHQAKILDAEIKKATKKAATPDRSDAPVTEPLGKEDLSKIFTPEVLRDPMELARALKKTGMGTLPQ